MVLHSQYFVRLEVVESVIPSPKELVNRISRRRRGHYVCGEFVRSASIVLLKDVRHICDLKGIVYYN